MNACPDGGYVKLQYKLLSDSEITCAACQQFLEERRFVPGDFKNSLTNGINEAASQGSAESPPVKKSKRKTGGAEDDDAEQQDSREEALAWLRTMEPVISVLEPGTFNKKFPFRCNLCKSPQYPEGKVGELSAMTLGSVKHFVGQHLKSGKHVENAERGPEDLVRPKAPCEGLFVGHRTSGQLFLHKAEFHLWASIANFQGCASHQYDHDATSGSWFVTAKNCEGQCSIRRNAERQICDQCMMLGSSHSVSWIDKCVCVCVCPEKPKCRLQNRLLEFVGSTLPLGASSRSPNGLIFTFIFHPQPLEPFFVGRISRIHML